MGSALAPYRSSLPASASGRGLVSYLTSRRNLAGSALALVGVGLILVDPVGVQGLLLVVGLYIAGALAVRGNGRVSRLDSIPSGCKSRSLNSLGRRRAACPPRSSPECNGSS